MSCKLKQIKERVAFAIVTDTSGGSSCNSVERRVSWFNKCSDFGDDYVKV